MFYACINKVTFHRTMSALAKMSKADHTIYFCLLSPDQPRKIAPTQKILLVFLKTIFFLFHVLRFSFHFQLCFSSKRLRMGSS